MKVRAAAAVSLLAVCLAAAPASAAPALVAQVRLSPVAIDFTPVIDAERFVLSVATPRGDVVRREFAAGQAVTFSIADRRSQFPDGDYQWELTAAPRLRPSERTALEAARAAGDDKALAEAQRAAGIPAGGYVESGSFRVADGAILDQTAGEGRGIRSLGTPVTHAEAADQVIPDDLIVQGSTCVGLDCVNNENFGFDTIRLKENNTRIKFEDTSVGTFPTNDWQLTANDSASGASSKFSIEDITGSKVPFTITAGAATNSIFADSTGRIGLRTSTPVLDLHINTSNTPAIRLEQNNSGGFTAQTWDIGANEANWFVRDVTGGSKLSFRIRPGAPTSSIDIAADGDVGIGTGSPDTQLHVFSTDSGNTGKVFVENTNATTAARELFDLQNNGQVLFAFKDTSQANRWAFATQGTSFVIDNQANGGTELILSPTGNLTITGTYSPASSREVKNTFQAVEPRDVLQKVLSMPITTWNYNNDPEARHIGPMAEDFYAAFQVGIDDKHLAPTDSVGVALAAIQGMHQELVAKDSELEALRNEVAALRKLIEAGQSKQP